MNAEYDTTYALLDNDGDNADNNTKWFAKTNKAWNVASTLSGDFYDEDVETSGVNMQGNSIQVQVTVDYVSGEVFYDLSENTSVANTWTSVKSL